MIDEQVLKQVVEEHTDAFDYITEVNFDSLTDHEIELLMDELSNVLRSRRKQELCDESPALRDEYGNVIVYADDCQ